MYEHKAHTIMQSPFATIAFQNSLLKNASTSAGAPSAGAPTPTVQPLLTSAASVSMDELRDTLDGIAEDDSFNSSRPQRASRGTPQQAFVNEHISHIRQANPRMTHQQHMVLLASMWQESRTQTYKETRLSKKRRTDTDQSDSDVDFHLISEDQ